MTQYKASPHIKLDEQIQVEKLLHSHLNKPYWDIISLIQNLLTGKKHVNPLLTKPPGANV